MKRLMKRWTAGVVAPVMLAGCVAVVGWGTPSTGAEADAGGTGQAAPGAPPRPVPTPVATARPLSAAVRAFLDNRCVECHDSDDPKGDLDLSKLKMDAADSVALQHWTRVVDRVREGEMPPKKKPQPPAPERDAFLADLGKTLFDTDAARQAQFGRTLGRRLTRTEFENTLADLLGVRQPLQDDLPDDARTYIFDTVAAGQDVSPQSLERYQAASEMVLDAAFKRAISGDKAWSIKLSPQEFGRHRSGINARDPIPRKTDAVSWSTTLAFHGRMPATRVPEDGWYRIKVNAFAVNPPESGIVWSSVQHGVGAASEPALFWIGSIPASKEPRDFVFESWMDEGHLLEIRPSDGTVKKANYNNVIDKGSAEKEGVAGIAMRSVEIEKLVKDRTQDQLRTLLFDGLTQQGKTFVSGKPAADLARLMKSFASRAFRRPANDDDVKPYVAIASKVLAGGASFTDALRSGYRAVLCSPRFLYLYEEPGKLDDHALACRLSYMFWSTMPDAALRAAADQGKLHDPTELKAQTERLLTDARSKSFVNNFCDQWLNLRDIDATQPDAKLYPEFDPVLQQSMLDESHGFFAELLKRDLSVSNFVDSGFAMLDARLAQQYGLPRGTVGPGGVRPVQLKPEWHRGGLLGQGAVLKVTANGTTTSPVIRGVWVTERLLGKFVPPPPPNIPAVEPDIRGATTIRDQLAKHRASEACAVCHVKIDPPGFALESFDVIGGWRDRYRAVSAKGKRDSGPLVDPSYKTSDGKPFKDITAFKQLLLRDREQIARCLAQKLLTYGTGASITFADRKTADEIIEQTRPKNFGLRSIVQAVVQSKAFQNK